MKIRYVHKKDNCEEKFIESKSNQIASINPLTILHWERFVFENNLDDLRVIELFPCYDQIDSHPMKYFE